MNLTLERLQPSSLETFRQLLGSNEFGGCFCAVWTSHSDDWVARCNDKSQPNFFNTKTNVEEGRHAGYLVYEEKNLVGWTGFPSLIKRAAWLAPSTFPKCFVVPFTLATWGTLLAVNTREH
jgi:hypothetical protein